MTIKEYFDYFDEVVDATEMLFRLVPADKIAWKPAEGSFTLGQHMQHIAESLRFFARGLPKGEWGVGSVREILVNNRSTTSASVEEAIVALRANYQLLYTSIGALTDERFSNEEIHSPQLGVVPRWKIALFCIEHLLSHKTQMFMSLKLLGVPVHTGHLFRKRRTS